MENFFDKIDKVLATLIQQLLPNCMNHSQEREGAFMWLTADCIKRNQEFKFPAPPYSKTEVPVGQQFRIPKPDF